MKEYKTVVEFMSHTFDTEMNRLIREGWRVSSRLVCSVTPNYNQGCPVYIQQLERDVEEVNEPVKKSDTEYMEYKLKSTMIDTARTMLNNNIRSISHHYEFNGVGVRMIFMSENELGYEELEEYVKHNI